MQNFVIGFDLDRVIFDTNAYVKRVNENLRYQKLTIEQIFEGTKGRKDLGFLFADLTERFGRREAERFLFNRLERYIHKRLKELATFLITRGAEIKVITVGDEHQRRKINGFPCSEVILASDDNKKVELAVLNGINIFIDDKKSVIEAMRKKGIKAFQALWFLDDKHKNDVLFDALNTVSEFEAIAINLLNNHSNSNYD